MLPRLIGQPRNVFAAWLILSLSALVVYFTLSGLSYLAVYVIGRRRFHPSYVPDPAKNRQAMLQSVVGLVGNMTLAMPFHVLIEGGHSQLYWATSERGVLWLIASIALYIAFIDAWIYWTHRALHGDFLYRHVHRFHHQWQVPNSWTSMAFHPIDSFIFAVPVHLFGFLVPLHGLLYLAIQTGMSFWSVSSHDRVALVRWRWFNYADNHTLHHWFYRCNYGQFFTFWDRIMGTWRDPVAEAATGRVPQGVLR